MSADARAREHLCEVSRSLFDRGLTAGSTGNVSIQVDDGWWVTPTQSCLGRLDPARLSKIDHQGRHCGGDAPTKELPLHAAIYAARGRARAVVHLHSHHAVAVSTLPGLDPHCVLPPITAYSVMKVGRVALVPYFRPGDPALADAVRTLGGAHASLLLAHHGPVVAGDSLEAAADAMEELEATARLWLTLDGRRHGTLNEDQIDELRRTLGATW